MSMLAESYAVKRLRQGTTALLLLGLTWLWIPAYAVSGQDIPEAYHWAADMHGVPPDILYAVALNESKIQLDHAVRPWPWTLNIAGKGYHFASRDEACDALFKGLFETQVIDVGIAQLNVRWQPQLFGAGRRFVDPCDALDPYANLEEAAVLLRQHYEDSGDWLLAAGRYHRPAGGEPAARYRRGIATHLAQLELGADIQQQLVASGTASVPFASVGDVQSASQSHSGFERYQPITIDNSLHWVVPTESTPVAWVDPDIHWHRLVAVQ